MCERELLLFALVWFIIGMLDEVAVDVIWVLLRLSGRVKTPRLAPGEGLRELSGPAAVLIPAWQEADVIGTTIGSMLSGWGQRDYRLYVGCYRNDLATIAAVMRASANDSRLRLVIHDRIGQTTKADCLNRLYAALASDEARMTTRFRMVVLQDAEDMVHPEALWLLDHSLDTAEFAQLPVRPELSRGSHWVAGHYADEFAESHAKAMVVRDALAAPLPAAGVGCAFHRDMLEGIDAVRRSAGEAGPFAAECFTEDYELGILISHLGGRGRFVRRRDAAGHLIATRSYFPGTLPTAVRQKTRWIHGIALQGWDRLGWSGGAIEVWMTLRDRKGPLAALVLGAAYLLMCVELALMVSHGLKLGGTGAQPGMSHGLQWVLRLSFVGLAWRAALRCLFTAREYGPLEGARAIFRIPVANVIAIMAGRRALVSYFGSLFGRRVVWDKTSHQLHPARSGDAGMGDGPLGASRLGSGLTA